LEEHAPQATILMDVADFSSGNRVCAEMMMLIQPRSAMAILSRGALGL
jgi:hypothetical protein